jgi:2-polyprenyl-6-hydroxyphenyl methylase/3-demethylubiquinone-9 3-methyltransferase
MHGGEVCSLVEQLPASYRLRVECRLAELDRFIDAGLVPLESFKGCSVLDWEAGDAAYSVAFLIRGARHVFAIDSWMQFDQIPAPLKELSSQLTIKKTPIREFGGRAESPIALVFANTVTEHLQQLPQDLREVIRVLVPGGMLFTNHDNYYQPVGSHDHGFLFYGRNNCIERVGPACWLDIRKCEASAGHRDRIKRELPWSWDERNERTLDPANCMNCHYYMRSQPWAHLIFQDQFLSLYPQTSFHTGIEGASLNKISPFQLRQFILEAGFCIERSERAFVENEPPDALVSKEISVPIVDLRTTMVRILARKPL